MFVFQYGYTEIICAAIAFVVCMAIVYVVTHNRGVELNNQLYIDLSKNIVDLESTLVTTKLTIEERDSTIACMQLALDHSNNLLGQGAIEIVKQQTKIQDYREMVSEIHAEVYQMCLVQITEKKKLVTATKRELNAKHKAKLQKVVDSYESKVLRLTNSNSDLLGTRADLIEARDRFHSNWVECHRVHNAYIGCVDTALTNKVKLSGVRMGIMNEINRLVKELP